MNLKETIQTLFREIEVYRSHSLFEEAMEKCRKLSSLIAQNDRIKNKQELLDLLSQKIQILQKESDKVEADAAKAQMSPRQQEVIRKVFVVSGATDEESAAWESASVLLTLGQFKTALKEFQKLISHDSFRLSAAKNILRCHSGLSSLDQAVEQYHQWLSDIRFPYKEVESIRSFLQDILDKKGVRQTLPTPEEATITEEEKEEEEAFIDILSIQLPSAFKFDDGRDAVLEVSYQSGNLISVIIAKRDEALVKKFKRGLTIDNVQFFSPAVEFSAACSVSAINLMTTGPRKEGYAVVLQVMST